MRRNDDILHILARFRHPKQEEFGIVRIGVFGSVARAENTEASDVDVVVKRCEVHARRSATII